jgi:hypothetical protein
MVPIIGLLLISTTIFSGPSCDWTPIKTDTTKSNDYSFQVVTFDCNIKYYKGKDENTTAQEAVIRDSNNNIVVNNIGNWGPNNERHSDEASIVNTPAGFPYAVILTSVYGGSNISHTYHIYSTTPALKKIGKITQPLNKYQTTKGNGSEREVVGFYEDKGVFLIDRLTTKGTQLGRCNACQDWNVETFVLGNEMLVPVDLRPYSFSKYKPYEMNEHYVEGLYFRSQDRRQEALKAFTKASEDGVIAADLWIAVMSTSDIDYEQPKDVINASLKEAILKFDKVQRQATHPSMIDTATDYIKMIKDNFIN